MTILHALRTRAVRIISAKAKPSPTAVIGGSALFLVVLFGAAEMGGRHYADLKQRLAAEIELESQLVCMRLGLPPGSEFYIGCVIELDGVRERHKARLQSEAGSAI